MKTRPVNGETIIDVEPLSVEIDGVPVKRKKKKSKKVKPVVTPAVDWVGMMMNVADIGESFMNHAPGIAIGCGLALLLGTNHEKDR